MELVRLSVPPRERSWHDAHAMAPERDRRDRFVAQRGGAVGGAERQQRHGGNGQQAESTGHGV